jgi:hypothetical protein
MYCNLTNCSWNGKIICVTFRDPCVVHIGEGHITKNIQIYCSDDGYVGTCVLGSCRAKMFIWKNTLLCIIPGQLLCSVQIKGIGGEPFLSV